MGRSLKKGPFVDQTIEKLKRWSKREKSTNLGGRHDLLNSIRWQCMMGAAMFDLYY
jgi:hypothetical protein